MGCAREMRNTPEEKAKPHPLGWGFASLLDISATTWRSPSNDQKDRTVPLRSAILLFLLLTQSVEWNVSPTWV